MKKNTAGLPTVHTICETPAFTLDLNTNKEREQSSLTCSKRQETEISDTRMYHRRKTTSDFRQGLSPGPLSIQRIHPSTCNL